MLPLYVAIALFALLSLRLLLVIRGPKRRQPKRSKRPLAVCVVLGSGGHTSEMFANLRELDPRLWCDQRPFYVVSDTDSHSQQIAVSFEEAVARRVARCHRIPRAREVGQSYLTSIGSTLKALSKCFSFMLAESPDVILTNGPGVCIPVVGASMLLATIGLVQRPLVLYTESFTCVSHLSLSGKILFRVADVFCVQWPQLADQLRTKRPSLDFTGPVDSAASDPFNNGARSGECIVTVGSTVFDELMKVVDSAAFVNALTAFQQANRIVIETLLVQKGSSAFDFQYLVKGKEESEFSVNSAALRGKVVPYVPFLNKNMQRASLVLSHAGAGTILEALASQTPLIVVPNQRLMSNHQLELAQALGRGGYLFYVEAADLITKLPLLRVDQLKPFPRPNRAAIRTSFGFVLGDKMS